MDLTLKAAILSILVATVGGTVSWLVISFLRRRFPSSDSKIQKLSADLDSESLKLDAKSMALDSKSLALDKAESKIKRQTTEIDMLSSHLGEKDSEIKEGLLVIKDMQLEMKKLSDDHSSDRKKQEEEVLSTFKKQEEEFNSYKVQIKKRIGEIFPFATTDKKGFLVCIQCLILDAKEVFIIVNGKVELNAPYEMECKECHIKALMPKWYKFYNNYG